LRYLIAAATTLSGVLLGGSALGASCVGYSVCPAVNYPKVLSSNTQAKAVLAAITAKEAASLTALQASGLSSAQFLALLGQTLVFDKTLSAHKNEACAFCHTPAAGFGDGVTAFTPAAGIFPGTVTTRAGYRTPPALSYSAFAPVLRLVAGPGGGPPLFVGGTFWDDRATGLVTGVPAADQAAGPLTNPLEMGFADQACAIRRIALSPYAAQFTAAWGKASLAITWPADTDKICAVANAGGADQTPVALSTADRAQVATTIAEIGLTIAAYETSTLASPFTSKFDAVQAGTARFTTDEAAGFALFTGQGHCAACHVPGPPPGGGTGPALFTDFSSRNDGIPHNTEVPYLTETKADAHGYVANAAGTAFIDEGIGAFLASTADANTTWQAQAANFTGTFQVPTLRNVAALASTGGTRTYMHNGFFSSLALIVHFYNTRDVLPTCTSTKGVGITCWPAPEVAAHESHIIGNLGLSAAQEAQIVTFLGTLTDGYMGG